MWRWLPVMLGGVVVLGLSSHSTAAPASPPAGAQLHVYGPGGPLGPMKECAERFSLAEGVRIEVVAGPEATWLARAEKNADIVFGGAEYMLTQFASRHPGLLDLATRDELYPRAAGILVRKGNPKGIRSLSDLTRPDVRLIDVNGAGQLGLWEDLAGRKGLIPGIQRNIGRSVATSAEAITLWKADASYDAWLTFESWHFRLKPDTELVRLPATERLYRGTPIAIATRSRHRGIAARFIQFLKSPTSHETFKRWGWE